MFTNSYQIFIEQFYTNATNHKLIYQQHLQYTIVTIIHTSNIHTYKHISYTPYAFDKLLHTLDSFNYIQPPVRRKLIPIEWVSLYMIFFPLKC